MKTLYWIALAMILVGTSMQASETTESSNAQATEKSEQKRKIGKKGDKDKRGNKGKRSQKENKKVKEFKEKNPTAWTEFVNARKAWAKLSKEERQKARQAYLKTRPELAKALAGERPKGPMAQVQEKYPKDFEEFKKAQESWKNLEGDALKEARSKFFEGREAFQSAMREARKKMKNRNKEGKGKRGKKGKRNE